MKNKGITLIALVITIVILLILAGISLSLTIGENGILAKAREAKIESEKAEEKEFINLAYTGAKINTKAENKAEVLGNIQANLDSSMGENKALVTDCGDGFDILIIEKNRYYTIENENLIGPEDLLNEKYPGDITKHGKYDGDTEEKAYQINCIEDLVKLSQMGFQGKYIALNRNLNFSSRYSYNNYKTTEFGNLNGNDQDGNELYTEMTTGTGFNPISGDRIIYSFIFDGKGYWIKNLYENYAIDNIGLIGTNSNSTIKNLNITGTIKGNDSVGAICGYGSGLKIENCSSYATVMGNNKIGGICGYAVNSSNLKKCKNYGNITGNNEIGGVIGNGRKTEFCENYGKIVGNDQIGGISGNSSSIENSFNKGEILGNNKVGGMAGECHNSFCNIKKCQNKGTIKGTSCVGGIVGGCYAKAFVTNSYNIGNIYGTDKVGGIIGEYGQIWTETDIYSYNCYNIGNVYGTENIGRVIGKNSSSYTYYKSMYYNNKISR